MPNHRNHWGGSNFRARPCLTFLLVLRVFLYDSLYSSSSIGLPQFHLNRRSRWPLRRMRATSCACLQKFSCRSFKNCALLLFPTELSTRMYARVIIYPLRADRIFQRNQDRERDASEPEVLE